MRLLLFGPVRTVGLLPNGDVDVDDLRSKLNEDVACFMFCCCRPLQVAWQLHRSHEG